MEKKEGLRARDEGEIQPLAASPAPDKEAWQEPELAFVEPKLTKHGKLKDVTGQFFGPFSP